MRGTLASWIWIADDYQQAGRVLERGLKSVEAEGWTVTQQTIAPVSKLWLEVLPANKIMITIEGERPD